MLSRYNCQVLHRKKLQILYPSFPINNKHGPWAILISVSSSLTGIQTEYQGKESSLEGPFPLIFYSKGKDTLDGRLSGFPLRKKHTEGQRAVNQYITSACAASRPGEEAAATTVGCFPLRQARLYKQGAEAYDPRTHTLGGRRQRLGEASIQATHVLCLWSSSQQPTELNSQPV